MLDLTKLPALELPSENIEFDVLGRTQKARITAADDEAFLDTADLRDNPIFESKIRRYFLKRCTDLSDIYLFKNLSISSWLSILLAYSGS